MRFTRPPSPLSDSPTMSKTVLTVSVASALSMFAFSVLAQTKSDIPHPTAPRDNPGENAQSLTGDPELLSAYRDLTNEIKASTLAMQQSGNDIALMQQRAKQVSEAFNVQKKNVVTVLNDTYARLVQIERDFNGLADVERTGSKAYVNGMHRQLRDELGQLYIDLFRIIATYHPDEKDPLYEPIKDDAPSIPSDKSK